MSEEKKVSMYQRYRPVTFRQLVGQEDTRESLREAVVNDTVSHAYLFVGERGCGKTSAAKILARAVNCENPNNGEPCNKCESCVEILEGRSLSVIEYDAGSNSGVAEMRDNILARLNQVVPGKRKVIIIDEAHLLSDRAGSALLLSLETPPPNVTFILCSTERRSILKTIISRCQIRTFRLIAPELMIDWLTKVSNHAELNVTPEQIELATRVGGGSARDSISALEAIASGETITSVGAYEILVAMTEPAEKRITAVLGAAAQAVKDGSAPREIAESLFTLLRECFFVTMKADSLITTPDWGNRNEVASTLGAKNITLAIEQVGEAIQGIQSGGDPRVSLEVALARWVHIAK